LTDVILHLRDLSPLASDHDELSNCANALSVEMVGGSISHEPQLLLDRTLTTLPVFLQLLQDLVHHVLLQPYF